MSDATNRTEKRGQATLSLVFLTGSIAVAVGVGLAFLVISFANSAFGFQAANRALAIASAGANDALLRLARNGAFLNTGYCVTSGDPANDDCDSGSAKVIVCDGGNLSCFDDGAAHPGLTRIISRANISNNKRQIEVVAAISSTTQVSVISWKLAPFLVNGVPSH